VIGEKLGPGLDEERVASVWQRIAAARRQAPARARRRWLGLGLVASVAVAAALWLNAPAPPVVAAALRVEQPTPGEWRLDDGSHVELATGTELEVLGNDGQHFVTKLARGRARFAVKPGGPRRWSIETSLATVEVVGTVFDVNDEAGRVTVRVEHGTVLVRGERVPGRVVRLTSGESLVIDAHPPSPLPLPLPLPLPEGATNVTPPAPAPRPLPAPVAPPTPTLADALAESDALRAAGSPRAAAERLERALVDFPTDEGAGVAAVSLGRRYLEVLHEPRRAATAFTRVVRAGRPQSLLEDAHARRVEAYLAAGRLDEARAALAELESAFPASPRAATLRGQLP
jgi:transmembrane sensor